MIPKAMYRNLYILIAGGASLLAIFLLFFNGSARGRADFAWVNGTEPETLDPCYMTGQPEGDIATNIFEGLTTYHPETLEPTPGVASSWTQEGLIYTFQLRPDAWWVKGGQIFTVDGKPRRVNAHDFVYAWMRQCVPESGSQYSFLLDYIVGVEEFKNETKANWNELIARRKSQNKTPPAKLADLDSDERKEVEAFRDRLWKEKVGVRPKGDLVLEVELRSFVPYFLQVTNFYPLFPVPREAVEAHDKEWILPRNIVTNGPYTLKDWRFNAYIRLQKNAHYWETEKHVAARLQDLAHKTDLPRRLALEKDLLTRLGSFEKHGLATLDALAIESDDTALNLYINGDVDRIRRIPPQVAGELLRAHREKPIPHIHAATSPSIYFYDVNLELPIFKDKIAGRQLRQALALAIDRPRLIREVSRAEQTPAYAMVPPSMRGYHAEPRFGTGTLKGDLQKANDLIQAFQSAGNAKPQLRILYNTLEAHKAIAAFIQDQWKTNIGIDAKLENQEWQVYLDSRRTGKFDLARAGWIPDYSDPNTYLELYTSDDLTSDKDPSRLSKPIVFNQQNHSHYNNTHYNRLVIEYAARVLDYLSDMNKRDAMLQDISSWPDFKEAIADRVRTNQKTSWNELHEAIPLYDQASGTEAKLEAAQRIRLFLLEIAEQMLMWDLPVIPIYHYTTSEVWPPELDGIGLNEREMHPAKFLRWKEGRRPAGTRYDAFPRFHSQTIDKP
jgi:oligopeptide transport system substrate-binding protein